MKRSLCAAGALVALTAAVALLKVSKAQCFTLTGHAICRVNTQQKLVAFTFDDGPTAEGLDAVLPALARYHSKGTFFLIGRSVTAPLAHGILAGRDEVANHSFNHVRMVFHSAAFYDDEIRRTGAVLQAAGAPKPTLFRPPFDN